jgi:hypothetical protein
MSFIPTELKTMLDTAMEAEMKASKAYHDKKSLQAEYAAEAWRCIKMRGDTSCDELYNDWNEQASEYEQKAKALAPEVDRLFIPYLQAWQETKRVREAIQIWSEEDEERRQAHREEVEEYHLREEYNLNY